ncbi:hypothetical protein [Streptomyces sp. NPDC058280]|uniref:hypothetical protein n=1 Tax=Streptomyces sp. NPDC058280 TaxID=3346419 RepID=UPI0036E3BD92
MDRRGPLTDAILTGIEEHTAAATPSPLHVRQLDNDYAKGPVAISTTPNNGLLERRLAFDQGEIVAAALVLHPRYADIAYQRWDEKARFIAHARQDVLLLISKIRRLRSLF